MTKTCIYCGREWQDNLPKCWDGVDGCGAFIGNAIPIGNASRDSIKLDNIPLSVDFFNNYATVLPMTSQVMDVIIDDGRQIELRARSVPDRTRAFIQGVGVEEPLGIVNSSATIFTAREFERTVTISDLVKMMRYFMPTDYGMWLINRNSLLHILNCKMGDGIAPVNGNRMTMFNFPVIPTNACPQIGERGDVILADLRFYLIGEYVDMCDGCPTIHEPIFVSDGYRNSPFVALECGGDKW